MKYNLAMTAEEVAQYIFQTFADVETTDAFGFTFFFIGSNRMMPFATIGDEWIAARRFREHAAGAAPLDVRVHSLGQDQVMEQLL